jgi:hypothetical protein
MDVDTDYQSLTNVADAYTSEFSDENPVRAQEGKLGGNTICTQPQDRKTIKIMNRVNERVITSKDLSQEPNALEIAGDRAKEQITRTRIRNGFTPVPKEVAPESSAIEALRARLLN